MSADELVLLTLALTYICPLGKNPIFPQYFRSLENTNPMAYALKPFTAVIVVATQ
jgi:hypothetical protein